MNKTLNFLLLLLTFLLALTFIFYEEQKFLSIFKNLKFEDKKEVKPDKARFIPFNPKNHRKNNRNRSDQGDGLIHTFSDSGKLLKSITYHEGIILSEVTYLNPPLVNSSLIEGAFESNYYHNDLPDYGKLANKKWSNSEEQEFLNIFKNLKFTESNPCDISLKGIHVSRKDNKCNQSESDSLGLFIKTKAPWIDISHLAYLKKIINEIPTLFIFISSIDKEQHEYMALYQFTFLPNEISTQFYGPFLNGNYQAVSKINGKDTLFIRHVSCAECHPWVYLEAIQFLSDKNTGVPLHFNYSFGEPSWSPYLEYELPGHGHSVEALVETRITSTGPYSIIQKFSLNKGTKTEWWGFNCDNFRCKTDLRKGDLPKDWVKEWKTGEPIAP